MRMEYIDIIYYFSPPNLRYLPTPMATTLLSCSSMSKAKVDHGLWPQVSVDLLYKHDTQQTVHGYEANFIL